MKEVDSPVHPIRNEARRRTMNAYRLLVIEITIREWLIEYWFFIAILLIAAMILFGGIGRGIGFFIILGFSLVLCIFMVFGGEMTI
jgi:hypothetical protein